jgi:hypothetical protein
MRTKLPFGAVMQTTASSENRVHVVKTESVRRF